MPPVSAAVTPAVPSSAPPTDEQILKLEDVSTIFRDSFCSADAVTQNKHRWSWLALRTARDQYLQHFGKIGTGDVLLLAHEIEGEKEREREREREKEKAQKTEENSAPATSEDKKEEAMADVKSQAGGAQDGEGDVKMEDR